MSEGGLFEAFGYRWEELHTPEGIQVGEGKEPNTLEPIVVLWIRFADNPNRLGLHVSPDVADAVAEELHRWARRAREKHYVQPPDAEPPAP